MPVSEIPVLVVDDHAVMGHALAMALRLQGFDSARALSAEEVDEDEAVVGAVRAAGTDAVVVLDLHLGDHRLSIPMIGPLRELGARVLILTAERDRGRLGECLEAGADGVFDKAQPFDQLVDILHDAVRGSSVMSMGAREDLLAGLRESRVKDRSRRAPFDALTPRESDVLRGLIAGRAPRRSPVPGTWRCQPCAATSRACSASSGSTPSWPRWPWPATPAGPTDIGAGWSVSSLGRGACSGCGYLHPESHQRAPGAGCVRLVRLPATPALRATHAHRVPQS